jgi:hypothetical protein
MLLLLFQSSGAGGGGGAVLYIRVIRGNDLLGRDDWMVSYFI